MNAVTKFAVSVSIISACLWPVVAIALPHHAEKIRLLEQRLDSLTRQLDSLTRRLDTVDSLTQRLDAVDSSGLLTRVADLDKKVTDTDFRQLVVLGYGISLVILVCWNLGLTWSWQRKNQL